MGQAKIRKMNGTYPKQTSQSEKRINEIFRAISLVHIINSDDGEGLKRSVQEKLAFAKQFIESHSGCAGSLKYITFDAENDTVTFDPDAHSYHGKYNTMENDTLLGLCHQPSAGRR